MNGSHYERLGAEVGRLVAAKNAAYGEAVAGLEVMLAELWPDGIPRSAYRDLGLVVRMLDKLKRLARDRSAFGESPYRDLVGYSLLGLELDERAKR